MKVLMVNYKCQWLLILVVLAAISVQSLMAEDAGTSQASQSTTPRRIQRAEPLQETRCDEELRQVWNRLDRLESRNTELAERNVELQRMLEASARSLETPVTTNASAGAVVTLSDDRAVFYSEVDYAGPPVESFDGGMQSLQSAVEELSENLTVTTVNKDYKIAVFGAFSGELIFASARPIIASGVTRISPASGRNTRVSEVHAKSSYLGAAIIGPRMGDFQVGGKILAFFYGENVLADKTGLFFANGFGELKNDRWRFALGLDSDTVNPLAPTTLNFVRGSGTGNLGYLRTQFRVERYLRLCNDRVWTAQFALSDPVVTSFSDFDANEGLTEDNGWPNIEGRLAFEAGPLMKQEGGPQRPFGIGVSGLAGQLRRIGLESNVVSNTWAVGTDVRVPITDWLAFKGEFFHGQTIGTYNGAVVQNFTLGTREGIRSTGGWCELSLQWAPCLHSHVACGMDDPRNQNLAPSQIERNEFCSANIIWEPTELLDIGFEVSYRETSYVGQTIASSNLDDNNAMLYHTRVRLKF